jgi:hypothetical protein
MNLHHTVRLSTIAAVLLVASTAQAAVWKKAVSLPVSVEYDSNPTMLASGEEGIWRLRVAPNYALTGMAGTDEYKVSLRLNLERSSDEDLSSNRQDPNLLLGWRRQSETGEFGVTAKYDRASTRFAELDESGLLVAEDSTRSTMTLGGNWRAALDERSSLLADLEYKGISYDGGSYDDYANLSGSIKYSRALSERMEGFIRASASRYDPEGIGASSNNYGAVLGVKVTASENLDWSAHAGLSKTTGASDDTGWQAGVLLHYMGVRSDLTLDVSRAMSPSGEGGYAESDQVRAAWGYAVDERTRAGVDVSWHEYKGATANTTKQIGLWASRELTPFWNARLSAAYKLRDESGADASGYLVGLTLVYSHPDF